jgi:hypothetical protein
MPRFTKWRVLCVATVAFARSGNTGDLRAADLDRPADLPLRGSVRGAVSAAAWSNGSTGRRGCHRWRCVKGILESIAPAAWRHKKAETDWQIVIIVIQTDSGACASNQRSTAGSTVMRIMADRTFVSTRIIKCSRLCRLTTAFENVLFQPDAAKQGA